MHSPDARPSANQRTNEVFVVGARGIPGVEGGVEKNTERLFPLLVEAGYDVTLVALSEHCQAEEYRGVKLLAAPSSRLLKTDKLMLYAAALREVWRRRPALVHMQGLGSALPLLAYRALGAKTVVRYGSVDYLSDKWGFLGKAGFLAAEFQLRFADEVIAVTQALADRLAGRGITGNVTVIPNAIDEPADYNAGALPSSVREPYILTVGRITQAKNFHRLAEAFNLFLRDEPSYTLVIAGGSDDDDCMEQLQPHLNERIKLLGRLPRADLGSLYRDAHFYINSSIQEGNSNSVLEAISWDCPLLLSGIPENRDFPVPEHHFFDQEDPAAIAAALVQAARDRERFRTDKEKFPNWREIAQRTAAIYRRLGLAPVPAR